MKYTLLCTLILFVSQLTFAQNENEIHSTRPSKSSSVPSYIQFKEDAKVELNQVFNWLNEEYNLDSKISFQLINSFEDKIGVVHDRYQQFFDGKKVKNAMWIIHSKDAYVVSMNGLLYQKMEEHAFQIEETNALEVALNFVGAESYKWQIPSEEQLLKRITNNQDASYFPKAEFLYLQTGEKGRFIPAYQFTIYAHSIVYKANIIVSAQTGEIISEEKLIHQADVVGTATTAYSGVQQITTDSNAGTFRLRESGRGNGINTFNMQQGTSYGNAVDFTDADNNWNNVNANLDQYATDAHFGAEKTYDYFLLEHNRNSIDNNGFQINSYVHYDVGFANAFWDGQRMTYGDGDGSIPPLTALDVVGHEISHGLTSFTADLIYSEESGALNESFSDIFGTAVENYARPGNWDWLIGGDWGPGFRSMSDPNQFGDPDTYLGVNWDPNEEVHINSGVQNHWFYLLSEGGTGTNDNADNYNVAGLGIEAAGDIAFRNLTVYLTPASDYDDARFFAIVSATDLYGGCTPEVESTTNAWYAVGVGDVYVPVTVADFHSNVTTSCEVPFTVNFQNTSSNGVSYLWDFGDGQTSVNTSPSHTYLNFGDFTVSLAVDGGVCGTDSKTYINYIDIDASLPCNYVMTTSGSNSSGSCSGTLTDSGGNAGNYGDNETSVFTIQPAGAQSVTLNFNQFDIEAESSCNYDYLEIYDGPNQGSGLIDRYCNGSTPPASITSTGGAITVKFYSDEYVTNAGFVISWSCNIPLQEPVSDFSSNVTVTCDGVVNFTDLSLYTPTSWLWDFGDGQTSTIQNPTHTYATTGFYTVQLTVTNSMGNSTKTYTDLIHYDVCAAIGENSSIGYSIYPNPASTMLFVKSGNVDIDNIELSDIYGRIVLVQSKENEIMEVPVERLKGGTYFILAKDIQGNVLGTNKFIKVE